MLAPAVSVALSREDPADLAAGGTPAPLRRADGTSVYQVAGSRLYTSETILAAEQAILDAAARVDGHRIGDTHVDVALLEALANGVALNDAQAHLVRALATSGARVQVAIAPAGSGKTTALATLTRAWTAAGATIVGLAPSAAAASVLRENLTPTRGHAPHTDTVAKLVWHLTHDTPQQQPGLDSPDRLADTDPDRRGRDGRHHRPGPRRQLRLDPRGQRAPGRRRRATGLDRGRRGAAGHRRHPRRGHLDRTRPVHRPRRSRRRPGHPRR